MSETGFEKVKRILVATANSDKNVGVRITSDNAKILIDEFDNVVDIAETVKLNLEDYVRYPRGVWGPFVTWECTRCMQIGKTKNDVDHEPHCLIQKLNDLIEKFSV